MASSVGDVHVSHPPPLFLKPSTLPIPRTLATPRTLPIPTTLNGTDPAAPAFSAEPRQNSPMVNVLYPGTLDMAVSVPAKPASAHDVTHRKWRSVAGNSKSALMAASWSDSQNIESRLMINMGHYNSGAEFGVDVTGVSHFGSESMTNTRLTSQIPVDRSNMTAFGVGRHVHPPQFNQTSRCPRLPTIPVPFRIILIQLFDST